MSDFQPRTDLPERIDHDDRPVTSSAQSRDRATRRRRQRAVEIGIVLITAILLVFGFPVLRVLVAMALMYVILMVGFAVLGAFARPLPDPLPAGELRRVRLAYRCSTCGTELKMTLATDEKPQAPRHCADEMELVTSTDEL